MMDDQKQLWLAEYKELGLEARQYNSEVYQTNRLMLPALIIGLLILYGAADKLPWLKIDDPGTYQVVFLGCVVISLIWICNVSRLAQVSRWHRDTIRDRECRLGLIGHGKVHARDEKNLFSKILRHNRLRFIGFGIYFYLLLNKMDCNQLLTLLCLMGGKEIISLLISVVVTFVICRFYSKDSA